MEEISLRELFFILRKWLWLIIGLSLIAVLASGLISYLVLEPEYETFTTLMVGKPKDYQSDSKIEYNDLLLNQRLVPTYGQLVKSRLVADKVIDNLDLNISYNSFEKKVNVNLVKDTEIIKIQVTDKDAALATTIANEVSEVFMETVMEKMRVENVQIIDKAQIPKNPISPRPKLNMAIGGVLGLMVGVFIAFLIEYLDNTLKIPEDVETHLDLPVLGAIPYKETNGKGIIVRTNPKSPVSEAFRTMRTNIQFTNIDKETKTIVITSSGPTEGKSTIAANLATAIAQGDKKVLLIDCDLRRPTVHKIFNISNVAGLTNVLMGENTINEIGNEIEDLEGLKILTSGPIPPNPAELLGSKRMKEFIKAMEEEYDMVILDTPPVGLVTDSAILSTLADGTLIVAISGKTDIDMVKRSKELLEKVNANVMGVILNKIPIKGRKYSSYEYYQYYSYYGDDE